jgi:hypothetical protein
VPINVLGIVAHGYTSMYCTNCGMKLSGNFCAGCGTRAVPPDEIRDVIPMEDWRLEVRYAVLLHFPEVRDRLAAVQQCAKKMTGEDWLELYDKAFQSKIPMKTVAALAAPIYAKLGIKTGKSRTEVFAEPPGQVMVDVLCALTRNGLPLSKVHQGQSGCVFEAKLPSDFWGFEGQVVVSVESVGTQTKVDAATTIPGQLFDWGKSARCLEKLFSDLRIKAA